MALEMRSRCEKCDGELSATAEAYICTFECTFCSACTMEMSSTCPNCGGELVLRPKAKSKAEASQP